MNKFKINLESHKMFIIVSITVLQLCIMIYYFNLNNNKPKEVECISPKKVTFNELSNSLNSVENIEILEIEDLDNKWYTKVLITGEKEDIIKSINELKSFKVYNYDITGNKGVLSIIIELYT